MRYLLPIGLSLGFLAGCAEDMALKWDDIHRCDSDLSDFFSQTMDYGVLPHKDLIIKEFDEAMPILPKEQPLHVSQAIAQASKGNEFCGTPNYQGKVVGGSFYPFDELPEDLQELTEGDNLVVINEDLTRKELEKFDYDFLVDFLDFYSFDENERAYLDHQKLVVYFRRFEDPRAEMNLLWFDFLELHMPYGSVGQNLVHEHAHSAAYNLGIEYGHLHAHEEVAGDPDLDYSNDPFMQSGLAVLHTFAGSEFKQRIADILDRAVDQVEAERSGRLEEIL